MKKEATRYCEECKNCALIELKYGDYWVQCKYRPYSFENEVTYCKYKKIKKENKRNVKPKN